jgi:glycosyltransferase involved in cell wall biosynthesis
MTKVSVISVFHNRVHGVARTVKCLLAQDHTDLEIILVDDGSTDGTGAALRGHAGDRVRVIEHENLGFVAALKQAIVSASGEYIAIMGSGDSCAPTRLSRQAGVLDAHSDVGVVGCGTDNVDPDTGAVVSRKVSSFGGRADAIVLERNLFHHGEIMFRRSVYDAVGGYREFFTYAQDRDLICRLSQITNFYVIEDVLYARSARLDGSVSADPRRLLLQRCLSDFAVYCHTERLRGRPDPLDQHGPAAALIKPYSPRLAQELRAMGLGALRRGRRQEARTFLSFAHDQQPHLLSGLGLLGVRMMELRAPVRPRAVQMTASSRRA